MANQKTNVTLVLVGLMLGMLISTLDQTIMATAMPTVARELGGLSLYSWVFSIYMLTSTTSMPIFGKLADLYGRKRVYVSGMVLFLLGSVLCSLSTNMTELVIFRGLQGLGAGALIPLAVTIIGDLVPLEKRGKMQGMFAALTTLANIIGPAAGGLFVEYLNWQWVFYINLPIGLAALIIILAALNESKLTVKRSIDWFGALSMSGAIVAILLALVLGGDSKYQWGSPQVIGLFAAGAVLLGLFLWIESKAKEPIVPLQLFKNRILSVAFIVAFLMSAGMFAAVTYIPLYVQGVIGVSPAVAGYILTPMMVALGISVTIGGRLMHKYAYRTFNMLGMAFMGIGFGLLATMGVDTAMINVIIYMIFVGVGIGLIIPTLNTSAIGAIGKERRGIATSLVQFFRSIGGTMGVSILGILMTSRMASGISDQSERFAALPADQLKTLTDPQIMLDESIRATLPTGLLHELQHLFSQGTGLVFVIGSAIAAAGFIVAAWMGNAKMMESSVSSPPAPTAGGSQDSQARG